MADDIKQDANDEKDQATLENPKSDEISDEALDAVSGGGGGNRVIRPF